MNFPVIAMHATSVYIRLFVFQKSEIVKSEANQDRIDQIQMYPNREGIYLMSETSVAVQFLK